MSQISIGPYKGVGFIRGLSQGLIDGVLQNLMFLYMKLMLRHFKYSQLPPAGQYHPAGNSTHAAPNPSFGPFTDLNRISMLFETVIRRARHLSHLQSEPDIRKG